ncbi:VOC family protein [Pseudokineococcus basanitobsidens]|uniref:VOC family protein n=1 Tax=Pseudokineococcus basanitobsidens TaxID=1926649 RepID=A0ABU8RHF0_9ACTN
MVELLRCELFPDDLDPSVRFYVDVLGFHLDRDERSSASPYVALSRGPVRLGLARRDDVVDVAPRRPPTGVELVLEVADLTAAHGQVVAAGWPLEEELTTRPWGLVDFRLLDPSGYYWRITTSG